LLPSVDRELAMIDTFAVDCLVPNTLISLSAFDLTRADENSVILPHEVDILDECKERGLRITDFDIMSAQEVDDCLERGFGGGPLKPLAVASIQTLDWVFPST